MIGASLLRYSDSQVYCLGDVETTGLNLYASLPWQLSYCTFTLKRNLEQHTHYIWWEGLQQKMSKGAARITRFDYYDYKDKAEDPAKVLAAFEERLYDPSTKVVSQNWLGYDNMIINVWRRALGLKPRYKYIHEPFKVYDTLALSRAIKKQIAPDTSSGPAFLAWQYRMLDLREKGLKCSLGAIGKELSVDFNEAALHSADTDVILNREVFRKQLWSLPLI